MNASKKRSRDKHVWEKWTDLFDEYGIDNIRLKALFRAKYTLDYDIVQELFNDDDFMAHIKPNQILNKENSFLAFLFKCRTGVSQWYFKCESSVY